MIYRCERRSDEGTSGWSDSVSGTTQATGLGSPTALTATPGRWVTLSWTAPADDGGSSITHYEYRVSSDGGTMWDPDWTTTGSTATTYIVEDLTFDTEYTFEVRAVNEAGNSPASNQATTTPKRRLPPFRRGVNLTGWKFPKTNPFITLSRQTFVNIKALGCDVVRLPFRTLHSGAPSYTIDSRFFTYLDQIVDWAEELGLYLIFDNLRQHDVTDETLEEYLVSIWPQIASHYKDRSNLVMYEVQNEPGISPSTWNPIQQRVIDTIRVHDNTHTIVVTGGQFIASNLNSLPVYSDNNLIYTFHFYFPLPFTHQGAKWGSAAMGALSDVPWPYDADRMPNPVPDILDDYDTQGTVASLKEKIDAAVSFSESRNVPVWCGEFGVYLWFAPPADRVAWCREVRTYMEQKDIAWTTFEYEGGFGLFEFENGGDSHFDYDFNVPLLEALGLVVPPQFNWVIESKEASFEIYTDGLAEGMSAKVSTNRGWLEFDDNSEVAVGNFSIRWAEARRNNKVGFDFSPNLDLSSLVANDYAFDFWVWGDTPGVRFQIRFIDSYNASQDDLPWRMRYVITEEKIGITSWDSQWHHVRIPLDAFRESGAGVGGDNYSARGEFTWADVNLVEIVAQDDFRVGIFRFDDIKITANVAPVIAPISPITVNENSTSALVTVSATDDDADSITGYGIVNDADGSQFEITDEGVLGFTDAPNYEDAKDVAFTDANNSDNDNAAGNNEYIVIVSATSGTGSLALTVRDTVTVTVTDVTEKPGTPAAPSIAETMRNSLKISWVAPTNPGPAIDAYDVRYILSSASATDKADDSKWTEVEDAWTSGDLTYTIGSLSPNTSYDVQVRAESDEGISDWSATKTGTTVQNQAPVFASVSSLSFEENSTASVVTVSAMDDDADDLITGYGIVDDADGSQFSIVGATGVLNFKTAPNYEAPADVAVTDPVNDAQNNEYIVIVSATGGAGDRELTGRDTLTITVTDMTEAPGKPATPTIAETMLNSLKISWTVPDNTGPAISSYDVRYILSSASDVDKADDSKWTEVEDAWTSGGGSLEYTISSLDQNTEYDVQVRATNAEGTSDWSKPGEGTTRARAMYWVDRGTDKVQRANIELGAGEITRTVEDLVTRPTLNDPTDIALDIADGKMYWMDENKDKIQRANLDGSNIEDLITTGLDLPTRIALDTSGGKMYWMDRGTDKIQRANLDGSSVEDLITTGLLAPSGIALDIADGKMYWVDRGTDKIQSANLDGSSVEDLITTGLTNPSGIALDTSGGKMYWVDRGTDKIQRANLNGSDVEDLITTGLTDPSGIALDIAGGKMYWVDRGTDKIQRADLDGSDVEDLITTGLTTPVGIALYYSAPVAKGTIAAQSLAEGAVQTIDVADNFIDPNEDPLTYTASSSDEGIATVAVMGSVVTITAVASGSAIVTVTATDLGGSMRSAIQTIAVNVTATEIMYWVDRGTDKIQRANIELGAGEITRTVEDLVTRPTLNDPTDIALDIADGKMYWMDENKDKIQRANLDGSNIEDLITTGLDIPSGIALDISGGKMYWVDRGTDKIQRANLDGSSVEDLITTGLLAPSGIALDISGGKMYWADRSTDKIQRADLDGSDVEDLVTGLSNPWDIALDISSGKMYWVDDNANKIQRADLDGSDVEDLITTGLTDPSGIALDIAGGKMYWVDRGADKIQRADLDGSDVEDLITTGLTTPVGIALY